MSNPTYEETLDLSTSNFYKWTLFGWNHSDTNNKNKKKIMGKNTWTCTKKNIKLPLQKINNIEICTEK